MCETQLAVKTSTVWSDMCWRVHTGCENTFDTAQQCTETLRTVLQETPTEKKQEKLPNLREIADLHRVLGNASPRVTGRFALCL